jgi:hypothetical protein
MGLLCLAAQGEPYGTVTIKGRVPTTDELFNLIAPRGTRRRDFNHWLAELEEHGVAQRDQRLAIVSPRMSQQGVTHLTRAAAAQSRWGTQNNKRGEDLHMQNGNGEGDLHMQTADFASHRSRRKNQNPPRSPPKGGARGRSQNCSAKDSRNAAIDMIAEDFANAEAIPHPGGATVVALPQRSYSGEHDAEGSRDAVGRLLANAAQ